MSELLIKPHQPEPDGTFLRVTPQSAGWGHVGFEALALAPGAVARRITAQRELCAVVIEGTLHVVSDRGQWLDLGGRESPWEGPPDAVYLPPESELELRGGASGCEVGLCWAPAQRGGAQPRKLPGAEVVVEVRGYGAHERQVKPILMEQRQAESLLVCEVLTPAGHWSSYPPHKHDRDAAGAETLLEETYYHRIRPARGFGLQRVYSHDRSLDEALAFGVMAGPRRRWAVANDPDHEWMMSEQQRG
jgi:5-deoxy-glucuronate isomerase